MSGGVLALASVAVVGLLSAVGALTLGWSTDRIRRVAMRFVAFAAGALLGDAFLHLIPESARAIGTEETSALVLAGILAFLVFEKALRRRHFRTHPEHAHDVAPGVAPLVFVNLAGDALHNFIDGAVIAVSYLVSVPLGLATTLAVVLHEIPQELGDFGVLVHGGMTVRRAILWNLASASLALAGAIAALAVGRVAANAIPYMLPLAAGGFVYLAAADLVPELLHETARARSSAAQLAWLAAGVATMGSLLLLG